MWPMVPGTIATLKLLAQKATSPPRLWSGFHHSRSFGLWVHDLTSPKPRPSAGKARVVKIKTSAQDFRHLQDNWLAGNVSL
jgi:hypothetical protein